MRRALLALGCAACGCAATPVTTHAELDPAARFGALVLEPVRGARSEDASALGQRLAAVALGAVDGQVPVWAPAEVQLLHPDRRDWSASTAVPLLRAAEIRPEQAVVVRARVDSGQSSSQQEVQGATGSALGVGATAELRWRATVEVFNPNTGQALLETTAEARLDAFAADSEAAAQQPGGVLERAAREAFDHLGNSWTSPRPPQGPVLSTWTVVAAAEGRLGHGLDAEVLRLQLLQVANPGLDETEAARLARLPPGVLVRTAPLGFRLRAQEVVLSVDAAPASAAALARCRFATSPVALEVRAADGHSRRVKLP